MNVQNSQPIQKDQHSNKGQFSYNSNKSTSYLDNSQQDIDIDQNLRTSFEERNSQQQRRGSQKSKRSQKSRQSYSEALPIEQFQPNEIYSKVITIKGSDKEIVVILKRTIKQFIYHNDSYYRDKGSKRNNFVNQEVEQPQAKDLKKFYKLRYYLFSKFDRGVKIDEEGWYSVTPETIAKHTAARVCEIFGEQNANTLDAFCGVGGNTNQFAKKCGFCVAVDMDPVKIECSQHNARIYACENKIQFIHKNYLKLEKEEIHYPEGRQSQIDVVYLSPPWGGTGYNLLPEYSLDHIYPDFNKILTKSLEFSKNLILFLPRNTSIDELIERLAVFCDQLNIDPKTRRNELVIEIEQIIYGDSCKAIQVFTGELAKIDHREVANYFYEQFCYQHNHNDEDYLRIILSNIFQLCGYHNFIKYFKKEGGAKISLSTVIKKIQKNFSEEEWQYLKKMHKLSRTNSKKSSTMSHASLEEEKIHSDTSSITSGKKSASSKQNTSGKAEKLFKKYQEKYAIEEEEQGSSEEDETRERKSSKKVVHFGNEINVPGHIELKDLTEKDFQDLIGPKNQDKRFYDWLHFPPMLEHKTDPFEDIEYFKQLHDIQDDLHMHENDDVSMGHEGRKREYSLDI